MNEHLIPIGIALLFVLAVTGKDDRLLLVVGVLSIVAVIVLVFL